MHEELKSRTKVKIGSDRSFGLTFAVLFLLVGMWPWVFHGRAVRLWALGVAIALIAAALVAPRLLAPLNKIWFRFGLILHRVINPVVMGIIFSCAVVPTAILLRLRGKDLLRLKRDQESASYWIHRDPLPPNSMSKQF
jgi:Saxitoxin biosynthesis operon protein SxtJ